MPAAEEGKNSGGPKGHKRTQEETLMALSERYTYASRSTQAQSSSSLAVPSSILSELMAIRLKKEEFQKVLNIISQIFAKQEERLVKQRIRTQKCREKQKIVTLQEPDLSRYSNVTCNVTCNVTQQVNESINNDVETMMDNTCIMDNTCMVNTYMYNTCNAREGKKRTKKRANDFPADWPNEQIIAVAVTLQLDRETAILQIENMRDWALSKDEKRADWTAFARNWFRKHRHEQRRPTSGVIQAADRLIELSKSIDRNANNVGACGRTSPPAFRLLSER